jgi:hypothetical protein
MIYNLDFVVTAEASVNRDIKAGSLREAKEILFEDFYKGTFDKELNKEILNSDYWSREIIEE